MVEFTEHWERLSPRLRQWITLGTGGVIVGSLALLIATAPQDDRGSEAQRRRLVNNLLTDVDPRDLGIDGLGRRLQTLEGDVRKIAHNLEQLGLDAVDNAGNRATLMQTLRRERQAELDGLKRELAGVREELKSQRSLPPGQGADVWVPPSPPDVTETLADSEPEIRQPEPPPLAQLFDAPRATVSEPAGSAKPAGPALSIRHVQDDAAKAAGKDKNPEDAIPEVRIPAGSILQGVLLSGMDAPTGRAARQDPYPALLRLKDNAILPNRFRADIRECFLLVGGYGDLGSERVYLRAESINCVRRDGRTIEVAIDGYAVGEDGKVGVRGRLVNKQGQVIGRAMQVSFLQGFSQLFGTVPVASVATGGTTMPYQQVFSGQALQGAAIAGTGKALDRLAEYYLDLAETIFPVLEVDAGRGVEVILNRGVGLKLDSLDQK
ncbi:MULTISPECIES: TraB/VirB10 family protein [Thiorhodovibrio]|uniref:TraB/VirB10 family protein n=1 Tax=Thiorhodovibrio TaxID=61593 RepID=UPI0019143A98|nr:MULTISPECIES: TraB/VirB10 family protein [Thiorhodovibrio]MBK5969498.1 conjugal transfer protein TrbI [Thiorhodovibrio winogradskyi]WPL11951.1 conjugal transfer pilus assembly protein TraB [Thiorhodovibrio litoralis]WPL12331.1 conjugal transfer pilus assembly protein TraB [Thiorhodovibrio litoralis]